MARFINSVRDDIADVALTAWDAGASVSTLKVYTGSVNGTRGSAPAGTLLGIITAANPGGTITNGVLTISPTTEEDAALASGVPGCYTACDGDGNIVWDGSASGPSGGGEMIVTTGNIVVGVPFNMLSGTVTFGA